MANQPITVTFGTHSYRVIDASWDSENLQSEVTYEDDNGIQFTTHGGGMARHEIYDAVKQDIFSRLAK